MTVLLLGAGRMGGALLRGWALRGGPRPDEILIRDPHPSPEAAAAARQGARLDPGPAEIGAAATVLVAVKPQAWRAAAAEIAPRLSGDAVVVSIAAGVRLADLEDVFGRPAARVMPTTAVEIGQGAASLFGRDPRALAAARRLFEPVAAVVELPEEDLVDVATAVSGSAPAYFYAFVEALEAAGREAGLERAAAARLVRRTLAGAAALLAEGGEEPEILRAQVTSKAGTTEAALRVLRSDAGLDPLVAAAVRAALARARELATST